MTIHPLPLIENSPSTPERELWGAVLMQAIKDAKGVMNTNSLTRDSARRWLDEGGGDWICDLIGLDPQKIRNAYTIKRIARHQTNSLSEKIFITRWLHNLTVTAAAKMIGVSASTVSRIERHPNEKVHPATRCKIDRFLEEYNHGNSCTVY